MPLYPANPLPDTVAEVHCALALGLKQKNKMQIRKMAAFTERPRIPIGFTAFSPLDDR
jgi:hypothetical protein